MSLSVQCARDTDCLQQMRQTYSISSALCMPRPCLTLLRKLSIKDSTSHTSNLLSLSAFAVLFFFPLGREIMPHKNPEVIDICIASFKCMAKKICRRPFYCIVREILHLLEYSMGFSCHRSNNAFQRGSRPLKPNISTILIMARASSCA